MLKIEDTIQGTIVDVFVISCCTMPISGQICTLTWQVDTMSEDDSQRLPTKFAIPDELLAPKAIGTARRTLPAPECPAGTLPTPPPVAKVSYVRY